MYNLLFLLAFLFSFNACGKPIVDKISIGDTLRETHSRQIRSYKEARLHLFGNLHYDNGVITDVYCDEDYDAKHGVGQGRIPNPDFINCEHTWPQSKFKGSEKSSMLTDLHHLFPSNSRANSVRGNHPFNKANKGTHVCGNSYIDSINGQASFEPPDHHKGNVARALFYFSTRYNLPIDRAQESVLREWHILDPIDDFEIQRNNKIKDIQGNSNIFIDEPSMVDQIEDF
ncbi:MAG: endonuclease [Lachnospiraceae bacterium]|nr:endonuclease [Lachnospiraceae bacterium]